MSHLRATLSSRIYSRMQIGNSLFCCGPLLINVRYAFICFVALFSSLCAEVSGFYFEGVVRKLPLMTVSWRGRAPEEHPHESLRFRRASSETSLFLRNLKGDPRPLSRVDYRRDSSDTQISRKRHFLLVWKRLNIRVDSRSEQNNNNNKKKVQF